MDDALTLLSAALDGGGFICIVGLKVNSAPVQSFYAAGDYQAAVNEAARLDNKGYNAYWATSTFITNQNRTAQNVLNVRVVKLDLDVGVGDKKYATQKEAVIGLAKFCDQVGLPAPTLVSSGYGVHAYWLLETAMSADESVRIGEALKSLCNTNKLKADPTTTSDNARILRVPGTHNWKNPDDPKLVKLKLATVKTHANATVVDVIRDKNKDEYEAAYRARPVELFSGGSYPIPAHLKNVEMDDATKAIVGGKPKSFGQILRRSLKGKGCAQLKKMYEEQETLDEPRWRAALSIANFCDDGDTAIHDISSKHKKYDIEETKAKAAAIKGPYLCTTFAANWPEECKGCPFWGKIASPIQLGEYVPKADPADNVLDVHPMLLDGSADKETTRITIPEYPFPYYRGQKGGVFLSTGEDEPPIEISKYDIYMVKRLRDLDPTVGYMIQMRVHHSLDGVQDFMVPATSLSSTDKLSSLLCINGLLVFDKEALHMRSYMKRYYEKLAEEKEVDIVRTQFGWTKDYKSFIIGNREITPTGWKISATSPTILPIAAMFEKAGSLEKWKETFNTYALPGQEAHAFGALLGFASPLITFTQVDGVVVNLRSQASGSGKSTCLFAQASIWGHQSQVMTFNDKQLAQFNRMGNYKNIPFCVDETTDTNAEDIGKFLYAIPQGRGRHRMSASANTERINNSTWELIATMSSNTSFAAKIQADQTNVQGKLMRLIEVPVLQSNIEQTESRQIFQEFEHHYGHAGEIFIRHVLNNLDVVRTNINAELEYLERDCKVDNKERFWFATCACVLVAGQLAKDVGLHDIDMEKMREWMIRLITEQRDATGNSRDPVEAGMSVALRDDEDRDTLGEFLTTHSNNILVIAKNKETNNWTTINMPKNELMARYEKHNGTVTTSVSSFNTFCADRNINITDYLRKARGRGVLLEKGVKRLAAGTLLPAAQTRCYVFQLDDGTDEDSNPA